jgi:hypothetical protein
LTKTDLRKTALESCTFLGVTFDKAALDGASFQGATLKQVSFRSESLWSHPMKSIHFDGAMMDKLTYAALKGMEADVSKVTVLSWRSQNELGENWISEVGGVPSRRGGTARFIVQIQTHFILGSTYLGDYCLLVDIYTGKWHASGDEVAHGGW